jgi:large subunit ribosomal protein L18e
MSLEKHIERKSNPELKRLIQKLYEKSYTENVDLWRDIAKRLEKPLKNRPEVNIGKIDRNLSESETALIPGKVLGYGTVEKKIKVAALSFSKSSIEKVRKAGGQTLTVPQIMDENPKGKGLRIFV